MSMDIHDGKVTTRSIEKEMKESYINYAMSVIVDRALPDVRDGLKPVQRRILYSMYDLNLYPDRQHRKSATIVGKVMGEFHPHGDSAIYNAMVRMAQDWSYRHVLVDRQGNFGSIDGDPPGAMRYTEAKLSKLAMEMLRDLEKDTVNFVPNFDESSEQPEVLPARFPNLLVNGESGIAVGMATNIPPHNLGEVTDGLIAMIDNPDITTQELMKYIKGPDFPTGGIILGKDGIKQAYETGRGKIIVRAKTQIEQMKNGKTRIVVTEIPFMVTKSNIVTKIAQLHRDKKVDGITDLRDESDKNGIRIVIELRKDANPHVVLNRLYKHTQLQETFGAIMLAIVDNEPRILTLKQMLYYYLEHQKDVIIRRTKFELNKAEADAHILEGYRKALDIIDEIIALIRAAENDQVARIGLIERFGFTEKQAIAILNLQLRRLTSLEREKIEADYQELVKLIARLKEILGDIRLVYDIIKNELSEIRNKNADERRTQIVAKEASIEIEDLIAEEDMVVTITHNGYIKRLPVDTYRAQRRGGRGITALNTPEEDFVEQLFIANTHSYVLFFTNKGRVYRLRGHEIPEASRNARGVAIINLIQLDPGERIEATIPIQKFTDDRYLVICTRSGILKKTILSEFNTRRTGGLNCINLDEDDEVVSVKLTDGNHEIMIVTNDGQAIRFAEEQVRSMGRSARGVKGITLNEGAFVIGMEVVVPNSQLLVISEKGFGKRTALEEYRAISRGGKGVRTLNITDKTGEIVGIKVVHDSNEVMLISVEGIMIRMIVSDIPQQGRNTQGVRLMKLGDNDRVIAAAKIVGKSDDIDEE
ncbi:MAG: DNA gyrase subunit A [Firmicutes bacterium]|nr:DNA gyrase subunit A [Bacillota bacterium]